MRWQLEVVWVSFGGYFCVWNGGMSVNFGGWEGYMLNEALGFPIAKLTLQLPVFLSFFLSFFELKEIRFFFYYL